MIAITGTSGTGATAFSDWLSFSTVSSRSLTTATTEKVQDSFQAIQSDLKTISSASDDLSADRKKDVQAANDEFTAKMAQIGQDFGNSLSIGGAATQAKAALQQLAQSYRSTFGQLDCS